MHYYIDGYNLLFRLRKKGESFQKIRESIIQDIAQKVSMLSLDATIVFDAQYQEGEQSRSHVADLEVVYTSEGETADEYIFNALKDSVNIRQETVVTSDRPLAISVKRLLGRVESIEEFISWLNTRSKNKLLTKPLKKPVIKKSLPKPEKKEIPVEEYYEQVFTERYEKLAKEEKVTKKKVKPKPKKAPKAPKPKPEPEDEMDRWLRLFDR